MNKVVHDGIYFVGNFGFSSSTLDGQTVKTRSLYDLFCNKTNQTIPFYDTESFNHNKFSILKAILEMCRSKIVVYLPAYKNLKYFFPFLYVCSVLFNFKIQLFAVGGWFENFIIKHSWTSSKLKKINIIYFQTHEMVETMTNKFGYKNVVWIPNFRVSKPNRKIPITKAKNENILKIVYMSRICVKKGIDVIFEFLRINKFNKNEENIIVDFYGLIHDEDKEYFESQIKQHKNASYKGILQQHEINSTLQKYDILLLPTKYYTEGFPGAILDAYNAGLPVIVTKWRYANEFVKNGHTGFVIPFDNCINDLIQKIELIQNSKTILASMSSNALEFSLRFTPENAWNIIKKNFYGP